MTASPATLVNRAQRQASNQGQEGGLLGTDLDGGSQSLSGRGRRWTGSPSASLRAPATWTAEPARGLKRHTPCACTRSLDACQTHPIPFQRRAAAGPPRQRKMLRTTARRSRDDQVARDEVVHVCARRSDAPDAFVAADRWQRRLHWVDALDLVDVGRVDRRRQHLHQDVARPETRRHLRLHQPAFHASRSLQSEAGARKGAARWSWNEHDRHGAGPLVCACHRLGSSPWRCARRGVGPIVSAFSFSFPFPVPLSVPRPALLPPFLSLSLSPYSLPSRDPIPHPKSSILIALRSVLSYPRSLSPHINSVSLSLSLSVRAHRIPQHGLGRAVRRVDERAP